MLDCESTGAGSPLLHDGSEGREVDAIFQSGLNHPAENALANVRVNVKRPLPRIGLKRAVIVGGGPSAADLLDEIRGRKSQGWHVFALNGAAGWLLGHGIVPDLHVLMDPRPGNVDFVARTDSRTRFLVASQCDPAVFEALSWQGAEVVLWHAAAEDDFNAQLAAIEPGANLILGGGTVGLRVPAIAYLLGYREMAFYGYDSSNRGERKHAYAAEQAMNAGQPCRAFVFNGKDYLASGPMAEQAEGFVTVGKQLQGLGVKVEVRGDGLLPDMWAWHVEKDAGPIEGREAVKYNRMWGLPEYRDASPGAALVGDIVSSLAIEPGQRVVDFGCGSGRTLAKLRDLGAKVLGVDITTRCLNPDIKIPLCVAPLWKMPASVFGDAGVCCDVMEHIPTEKVDATLKAIAHAVPRCFFHICTRPDNFGAHIGETLHLTVRPDAWWLQKLSEHWGDIDYRPGHPGTDSFIAICRSH